MRDASSLSPLTPRERDVLAGIARGLPNKVVGNEPGMAEITVKLHVRQILRKLKARNRSEASAIAKKTGLLQ